MFHLQMCANEKHQAGVYQKDFCLICEHVISKRLAEEIDEIEAIPWDDCPAECLGEYFKKNITKPVLRVVSQDSGSFIVWQ
jgi:hypothetical protein